MSILVALLLGAFVTTRRVREYMARRALAEERARLEEVFDGHRETLRRLEAEVSEREARRLAARKSSSRPATQANRSASE